MHNEVDQVVITNLQSKAQSHKGDKEIVSPKFRFLFKPYVSIEEAMSRAG